MKVDVDKLERELSRRLRNADVKLTPIDVQCAWPVFRAMTNCGLPLFVKLSTLPAAEKTLAFLQAAAACPFLPRPVLNETFCLDGAHVICLEWKAANVVTAECMTDGQLASFADGCRKLADVLSDYHGEIKFDVDDIPDRQFDRLSAYAVRYPMVSRLLRPLVDLPAVSRSYGTRPLTVIHGDFQPKNYGFDGERFAAVFDFDALTKGLACEDAAYAFTERARRAGLSSAKRRRLTELFLRLVRMSPWSKDEWTVAVNHARLRIAVRRLEKHPDSMFVAFDIARRDKPLAALAAALEGVPC